MTDMRPYRFPSRLCGALLAAACGTVAAQSVVVAQSTPLPSAEPAPLQAVVPTPDPAAARPRFTAFASGNHSALSAGLPDGEAVNLRGVWAMQSGDTLIADVLDERKFGQRGGVAALSYTRLLSPDWYAIGTVAGGHGGPNWARWRVDGQLSRKWLAGRQLVTSVALYHASFDNNRSDDGLRLSATWYSALPAVFEVGTTINVSRPGNVRSHMPYASATFGREGAWYLSGRVSSGREAYQAIGANQQLVDFRSDSVGLGGRLWLGRGWGLTAQAEHYRNPSYQRNTVGAGLFVQW